MLDILYTDNHHLVVNKPAGLLVQGDTTGDETLLDVAKAHIKKTTGKPGNVFLGLVHRIDRPVSGAVLLARTSKAAARLSDQFRRGIPKKTYLAIVSGKTRDHDTLEDNISRVANSSSSRIDPKGKASRLDYLRIGFRDGQSLLQIQLDTGRHHQIRVQLASRGFSILGDMRYDSTITFPDRALALHAHHLQFEHIVEKTSCHAVASVPDTWPEWARNIVEDIPAPRS